MYSVIVWLVRLFSAIGAINWGLVVFLDYNLVVRVSEMSGISGLDKAIYAIVASSGIFALLLLFM